MGFAEHPYCVVLQKHAPDSTDAEQQSAYADEVLVLALTGTKDKTIRGRLMIYGDTQRIARALLATDFRNAILDVLAKDYKPKPGIFARLFHRKEEDQ